MSHLAKDAAEACRQISTEAENIRERGKAVGGLLAFLNPQNWKSENETKTQFKNIMGIDMSTEAITNIKNVCNNIFTGVQTNIIDIGNCPICQTQPCNIRGVRQSNTIQSHQECGANSIIDKLKENKGDFQSLASIKAIQDAKGAASGNTIQTDTCNYTDLNMSTKEYLDALSSCGNVASSIQTNELRGCMNVIDIIQANDYKNYQKCIANTTFTDQGKKDFSSIMDNYMSGDQQSEGTDLLGIFNIFGNYLYYGIGGITISLFLFSMCCVMLIYILFSGGSRK